MIEFFCRDCPARGDFILNPVFSVSVDALHRVADQTKAETLFVCLLNAE